MSISSNDKVNAFLADVELVSVERYDTVLSLRALFLKCDKTLVDEIKYGGLAFLSSGSLIGGIYLYKEHMSVEFSNGASFSDKYSLLEGGGKKRRHLKVLSQDDVKGRYCAYYIKQAV